MTIRRVSLGLLLAISMGALTACDSSEERAEKHYQTGIELLQKGDIDRALVEFRNVFKLNGRHHDARAAYARAERQRGNLRESYSQYLRLVEQYPDDLEARIALAEMAMETSNWEALESQGREAMRLAPDNASVKALQVVLDYRKSLIARDEVARDKARAAADALIAADPKLVAARRVVVDDQMRDSDWRGALATIDAGLKIDPSVRDLYPLRLGALYQLGDTVEIEQQLKAMVVMAPGDRQVESALIGWYMSQGNPDAAEAFLRDRIVATDTKPDRRVDLIRFLVEVRGTDAAKAELDKMIAANVPQVALFKSLKAGFDFEQGNRDKAITDLRAIIAEYPEAEQKNEIKVTLARMLSTTGNEVGARALIEEVLKADATNVEALKIKANWLVDDDRTGEALAALRTALDQNPRDAQVMTLMARAHERDGNRDLMGEMLALSVEASGRAPDPSMRYAAFLAQDQKFLPAEEVLVNALRLKPQDENLLRLLGRLYVQMKDWPRAEHIERTLEGLDSEPAKMAANEIKAQRLSAQNQDQDLLAFLNNLSAGGQGGAAVDVAIIRANMLRGDTTAALAQADKMLATDPSNPALRFLRASVLVSSGKTEEGEAAIRAVTRDAPKYEPAWMAIYNALYQRDDKAGASAVLKEGLAALPDSPNLNWILAGERERAGDIDGAITIYEKLYERDSNALVVANNLASLLSTHHTDAESLDRAYTVARRLRGSTLAPFQDTYGWIAYRRGLYDDALAHLEPAARTLSGDPAVQYHLAATYAALGRRDAALDLLRKVEGMSDPAPTTAVLEAVRAEIAKLTAPAPGGTTPPASGN